MTQLDEQQHRSVKKALPRTWTSFFGRFSRLTRVQLETIPRILQGRNVIVASATATGKTEAVMAPLAEQLLQQRKHGTGIVYVVPTRALANDALTRIEGPMSDLGLRTAIKHGDSPGIPRGQLDCLITTPESLDSMLCRHPNIFNNVTAVVLDEIHLLDSSYRGDQVIVLLNRLRKIGLIGFHVHLLSATFSDPHEIAKRYVNEFEVVNVPGQRQIDSHFLGSVEDALKLARKHKWLKVLCFSNKRATVESITARLRGIWGSYPVVCHHGSLSK